MLKLYSGVYKSPKNPMFAVLNPLVLKVMDFITRKLGPSEEFLWHLDKEGCMNFVIIGHLNGPINIARLKQALLNMQETNTILKSRIIRSKNGLEFTTLDTPPIPFTAQEIKLKDFSLDEAVNKEINNAFDTESMPLVRSNLFQDGDEHKLIVTINHILFEFRLS